MKIGILSDTHMPKKAKKLPLKLVEGLNGVELILHAGDWSNLEVYEELQRIAPVKGVFGNVDLEEIRNFFEEKIVLDIKGFKIGVVHGHTGKKKTTPLRALEAFQGQNLHVIIFGHSHIPHKEVRDQTILFNPGSPTDKRFQRQYSYGIMDINNEIHIEHHYYEEKG